MAVRKLEVQIVGNAKGAQKAIGDLEKTSAKSSKGISKSLGGVKDSLLGIGIAAAGAFAFKEWNDAQKIAAQTDAVLKSTGNTAKTTASEIEGLAGSLSEKTGIDDESIQAGANWIATFKNVANQAGEGSDIFDRATETALDLSVAMSSDMTSASNLLAKALNDPTKGITALTRAGVTFDAQQKAQIKTLHESGDVLGAQKIILAEVESQVKGSAEAQATAWDKAKVSIGNFAEAVGGTLAPAVERVSGVAAAGADTFGRLDGTSQALALSIGAGSLLWLKYRENVMDAVGSMKSMDGGIKSSINSMGRMDKAVIGVAAGAATFSATLAILEDQVKFTGDLDGGTKDLEAFADGLSDGDTAVQEFGGSIDSLADSFKMAYSNSGYWDRLSPAGDQMRIRQAQSDIEGLDDALAQMVASGNGEKAAAAYGKLAGELTAQGASAEDVAAFLPDYWTEVDRAATANGEATGIISNTTGAIEDQGDASVEAERKTKNHADAMSHFTQEAGDAEEALRGYYDELFGRLTGTVDVERALDDYAAGLFANTITLDDNTEAGRKNRENMAAVGQAAVDMAAQISATGDVEGARNTMEQYRLKLIETWTQAGYTEDEILVMQTTMGLTPAQIETKFPTNAPETEGKVKNLGVAMGVVAGTHVVVDIDDGKVTEAITSLNDLYLLLSNIPSGDGSSERAETRGRRRDAGLGGGALNEPVAGSTNGRYPKGTKGSFPKSGPGRARGGRVMPGTIYPINERGEEGFMPDVPGRVIPHGPMQGMLTGAGMRSGGGGTINYITVYVQGSVMTERDLAVSLAEELNRLGKSSGRSLVTASQSNFRP